MSVTLKGGTNGPFIPVEEESSRNWLYRQIAVGEFSLCILLLRGCREVTD